MKRKIFLYAGLLLMGIMGALGSGVVKAEDATLVSGERFNGILVELMCPQFNDNFRPTYWESPGEYCDYDYRHKIMKIERWTGNLADIPVKDDYTTATGNLSQLGSDVIVWVTRDDLENYRNEEIINFVVHYYTDADTLYFNEDSSEMFSLFWELEKLDLVDYNVNKFDTSNVTNMESMFNACSKLEALDVSKFDTSNVTNMESMFSSCSSLTQLDVSKFDTSNVTNMIYMFEGCSKLETLDVSKFDTSNVTNMKSMFEGCSKLETLDVSKFDTSNVTNMRNLFNGCSKLETLDLSNFDTSNVTNMESMFYGVSKLKTIYVSDSFKTDQVTASRYMFMGSKELVGGNGTVYDSSKVDKEYARIDGKKGLPGYFSGDIPPTYTITLDLNGGTGIETLYEFEYGDPISLGTPTRGGYRFLGREPALPATMPGENLNVKATWKKKSSNSSSSSSSSSSETATGSTTDQPSSGTNAKDPEQPIDSSVMPQNDDNVSSGANAKDPENNNGFSQEFIDAYNFAFQNGITTMPTIDQADMTGNLTRIQMAKMLSYYAINIMGKKPDETRNNKFKDVSEKLNSDYNNGVTLAYQLGIMGINMPNNNFRPNDLVTRGEFVTALSRMVYGTQDGEYENTNKYYTKHIEKLNEEEIIKQIDPSMKELRAYVMIMLKRASEK